MAQLAILAVKAVMSLNKGAQDRKLGYQEAGGLRDAAMRKAAATTAEVGENERTKQLMESRAIALAAFQGGGVDDPSMQKLIGDLNAEGEYRILSRLYVGMGEAAGLEFASEQAMRAGDAALNRGYVAAATTVLSSYGSDMWSGGKAPNVSHSTRAAKAKIGTMDYNPSSAAARYA